jgi:hypothetical protein
VDSWFTDYFLAHQGNLFYQKRKKKGGKKEEEEEEGNSE